LVRDPVEGVDRAGSIVTGVGLDRVPAPFGPVIDAVVDAVVNGDRDDVSSLYLYGSVATGMAVAPTSDVDLLSFGMETEQAEAVTQRLSRAFADVCRAVGIAVAQAPDLVGDGDAAYGNRVFLRHYCVHLCGPPLHVGLPAFPADRRAARGLNGDIDSHARRWRSDLERGCRPGVLGRRLARKSLLATAGLVSVHDHTWTTDRRSAAGRWEQIEPVWATSLNELIAWSESCYEPSTAEVEHALNGIVTHLIDVFSDTIGLWDITHE
jgi:hypothetical protein